MGLRKKVSLKNRGFDLTFSFFFIHLKKSPNFQSKSTTTTLNIFLVISHLKLLQKIQNYINLVINY